jgi:hypothetical protein
MAWPMPVLAPVTSAVLPARLKEMPWRLTSTGRYRARSCRYSRGFPRPWPR